METELKEILRSCGFGFKKKFGQNFITDKNLLSSIVSLSGVEKTDTVVEIGCGAGTLTRAIAAQAARVVAFEVDLQLKPVLERTLAGLNNAEVRFSDFLKCDLAALEEELGPYLVIANLPYYVTTPLITMLLERATCCKSMTVMVQEEVAQRFCASAGTPEYGAITAAIALNASAKIVKKVSRNMFTPRPNVDSAVVYIKTEKGRLPVKSEEMYKKVVRAAFSSRRKTLENNLVSNLGLSRGEAKEIIALLGIAPAARGETLSPEDFARLADEIYKTRRT